MLSKETIERIDKEAKDYVFNDSQCINLRWRELYARYNIMDYIAGATVEATRYEQERKELVDGIEFFLKWLKEKRPSLGGLGAPIMMLQELLLKYK